MCRGSYRQSESASLPVADVPELTASGGPRPTGATDGQAVTARNVNIIHKGRLRSSVAGNRGRMKCALS